MGEKQKLMDAIFDKVGLEQIMSDPALQVPIFFLTNPKPYSKP